MNTAQPSPSMLKVLVPLEGNAGIGGAVLDATGPLAWRAQRGSVHVAGIGRVGPVGTAPARGRAAAAAVLDAWSSHREALAGFLDGAYAFAVWDADRGEAIVATDRFATRPVYHATRDRLLAVASSPDAVCELLGLDRRLSERAILAYCYFHVVPAPLSIREGVSRLDVGELLHAAGGRTRVARHWTPRFDERAPFDFERERAAFLDAIRRGVSDSVAGIDPERVGAFLSGGTDSSTISGMLGEVTGRPARTFSIGFDVQAYDERRFSRLAVERFGTDHTEHTMSPAEAEAAIDAVVAAHEQPFGNSSAVPTYVCARLAASRGVEVLLGGDGGDELFGGNERYAKQRVFAYYESLPRMLRQGLLEPAARRLLLDRLALTRKAKSYVQQASVPLPARLQTYNLLHRLGWADVFDPEFLLRADRHAPERLEADEWSRSEGASQLNRLLAYDFKFTLGDNDLPKVLRMCEHAGVEAAFPMLARDVVELSLRLPPEQKLKGTELRHFFRKSLRGFLPDEIIDKQKHGFGMPFGAWMLQQPSLSDRAISAMEGLVKRRIMRGTFIDRVVDATRSQHAGYFGTMIWVLMMLEAWIESHPETAGVASSADGPHGLRVPSGGI